MVFFTLTPTHHGPTISNGPVFGHGVRSTTDVSGMVNHDRRVSLSPVEQTRVSPHRSYRPHGNTLLTVSVSRYGDFGRQVSLHPRTTTTSRPQTSDVVSPVYGTVGPPV